MCFFVVSCFSPPKDGKRPPPPPPPLSPLLSFGFHMFCFGLLCFVSFCFWLLFFHMPRVLFSIESHFRLAFSLASVAQRAFRYCITSSLSDKGRQRDSALLGREASGSLGHWNTQPQQTFGTRRQPSKDGPVLKE